MSIFEDLYEAFGHDTEMFNESPKHVVPPYRYIINQFHNCYVFRCLTNNVVMLHCCRWSIFQTLNWDQQSFYFDHM
jgi:hypothetical protein